MINLLLPVAGKSSRFENMRPKWLLTMPSGKLMIEESISGIDLDNVNRTILICLKEHLDKFVSIDKLKESFKNHIKSDIEICILEDETSCQAETIYKCINKMGISGSIFIKDCDNYFDLKIPAGNSVANLDLNKVGKIDASNKSYIKQDENLLITNIVEKNIISNRFCCGGYGFESSNEFVKTFEEIRNSIDGETYISHVIYKMILDGKIFKGVEASNYIDWGTKEAYQEYCSKFVTIFCDVDGVLLENGSKFGNHGWATEVIEKNIIELKNLQKKGKLTLILTTSRPSNEESYVRKKLAEKGLQVDKYIGDLPHTKRLLVNDFASTNPYPSASSINLPRNSDELNKYIDHVTK